MFGYVCLHSFLTDGLLLSDWLHFIIVQCLFCEWTNKVDFVFYISDSIFFSLDKYMLQTSEW